MSFVDRYGPWALIAGASEGTGRSLARRIAVGGVNCILLARREALLTALADEIRAESGVQCMTAAVDLASPDALEQIMAAAGSREVGLFVSNAGADANGSRFLDRDLGTWLKLVQRNVTTTLQCCRQFAPSMRARR